MPASSLGGEHVKYIVHSKLAILKHLEVQLCFVHDEEQGARTKPVAQASGCALSNRDWSVRWQSHQVLCSNLGA